MHKWTTRELTLAALTAAAYAALTLLFPGPSYGYAQLRIAEALTVLPFLFPAAAPGLLVGCLAANLLSPYGLVDIVCGTAATGLAAVLTMKCRYKWLAPLPPVLCNAFIVGAEIAFSTAGGFNDVFWTAVGPIALSVGLGELAVCYVLGLPLLACLPKIEVFRGMIPERRLSAL